MSDSDPRRLYDAKDMAGAILYAVRVAGGDAWPLIANADGSLNVALTSGTLSLSTTATTINLGRSLTSSAGTLNATTGTLLTAGSNRSKVFAVSFTTTSTTSSILTLVDGAYSGTVLWRAVLLAPSGGMAGANLAVSPPGYLCRTTTATTLRPNCSSAIPVEWSVAYFDEA